MLRRKQEGAGGGGSSGVKFIWEALQMPALSWRVIRLINALQSPAVESDFVDSVSQTYLIMEPSLYLSRTPINMLRA